MGTLKETRLTKREVKAVAQKAGCSWRTVYNWLGGKNSFFEEKIKDAIKDLKHDKANSNNRR